MRGVCKLWRGLCVRVDVCWEDGVGTHRELCPSPCWEHCTACIRHHLHYWHLPETGCLDPWSFQRWCCRRTTPVRAWWGRGLKGKEKLTGNFLNPLHWWWMREAGSVMHGYANTWTSSSFSSPELPVPSPTSCSTGLMWLEGFKEAFYRVLNVKHGELQRKMSSEMVAGKASRLCQPISRG